MVRLGGLWKNKSKNGLQYLSGQFGGRARMIILPNKKKSKESEPDFVVFIRDASQTHPELGDNIDAFVWE